jgi:hypothetical protein
MDAYSIREVAAAPGISVPGFSEGWIVQDSVLDPDTKGNRVNDD